MKIIKSSNGLTTKEQYRLCMGDGSQKMIDAIGQTMELRAWALYEDVDKATGEVHEVLSIANEDGEIFSTVSRTFIETFTGMMEFFEAFGETVAAITITGGKSKNGRQYVSCTIA